MSGRTKLKRPSEWKLLTDHAREIKKVHLKDLFNRNPDRADLFSLKHGELFLDYSKNLITTRTMELLFKLARAKHLNDEIEKMFSGEKINRTEDRPVLHVAQRDLTGNPQRADGQNITPLIFSELEKMKKTAGLIRNRKWLGHSHKPVRHIVNIGIGGSDLGPRMAFQALEHLSHGDLTFHFLSNIDGSHIHDILNKLNPEKTLFMVASKSFKTEETLANARTARQWLLSRCRNRNLLEPHFLAITGNAPGAREFGIIPENILPVPEWVGGRFSITSAIGLPVMVSIGARRFRELLDGFHSMDTHFRLAPFENNMPVILALLGIWYINFLGASTQAVIPYSHHLREFPAFLQQLDMESNGKSVDRNGEDLSIHTAPVVWGQPGTNGQHAFFQLLHQGTRFIPSDFIGFSRPLNEVGNHHIKLMANFFAQTQALAFGKEAEELRSEGVSESLIPFQRCPGNRPSNTILARRLTPFVLGELIALYEHKIFTQGVIWDIFSFDQWGVELGKTLARKIAADLEKGTVPTRSHDSSTIRLIGKFRSDSNNH